MNTFNETTDFTEAAMKVKELVKLLKTMPQDEEIGFTQHDYSDGYSENINSVRVVNDDDLTDLKKPMHRVVICG